ncbi:hypothetical protein AB0F07_21410 [Streptomyces fructofermentans]|uniref:hypothetical protein n=1 Tax=Streptomyces fructofermentans TaxID=152141 RepID=UPI003403AF95
MPDPAGPGAPGPVRDRPDFRARTDALVVPDPAGPHRAKEAVGSLRGFFHGIVEDKRARQGDDLPSALCPLPSALVSAHDDGDTLAAARRIVVPRSAVRCVLPCRSGPGFTPDAEPLNSLSA